MINPYTVSEYRTLTKKGQPIYLVPRCGSSRSISPLRGAAQICREFKNSHPFMGCLYPLASGVLKQFKLLFLQFFRCSAARNG